MLYIYIYILFKNVIENREINLYKETFDCHLLVHICNYNKSQNNIPFCWIVTNIVVLQLH